MFRKQGDIKYSGGIFFRYWKYYEKNAKNKGENKSMKKILSLFLTALFFLMGPAALSASAFGLGDHVTVISYDPNIDYMQAMQRALKDGGSYALQVGAIYEKQRNFKIDALGLNAQKTAYFSKYTTAQEILKAMEADSKPKYTQEDLDLLSRIIYAEVGCDWIPDWVQQMVGSVVLNRVKSPHYPNTIKDVIYQDYQYSPVYDGSIYKTPSARAIKNAKYVLEHGSICPANVIGQNSEITGSGVYKYYRDDILGTTVYFCFM